MSGPRSRNPVKTREFYDSIMADERAVEQSRVNVTTEAGSVPKIAETATSTAIPAARPQLDVKPREPDTKTTISTTTRPTTTTTETIEAPSSGMFNNVWEKLFGSKKQSCLNGGKLRHDGICECSKYFNGTACEKKQCLNGGQLHKITTGPITYECQCPDPQYMEGAHCERIRCANSAPLLTAPNGTWHCDCSQRMFYKGVFCEKFSPPMGLAIPLAVFLVFIICCGLCRMDWCPRKRTERRRDSRSVRTQNGVARHRATARGAERGRIAQPGRANPAQEFLLQGNRSNCTRNPVAFPASGNPYIIRLDTIPTFNPNMIGGVDPAAAGSSSSKPIEPPPSYEQAVQAPPMPAPPRYSERSEGTSPSMQTSQQPPPPNIPPPVPPSS